MKLGLIIPYRNRKEHLDIFIQYITKHFRNNNIDYKIIIVKQANNNTFNKCRLMNIGAEYLYNDVDYFCFHDVDLIPDKYVDYNIYDNQVIHLCGKLIENKDNIIKDNEFYYGMNFNDYYNNHKYRDYNNRKLLGGVTLILKEIWRKHQWNEIFQGWGYEDNEYWYRLEYNGYKIKRFNGKYISLFHFDRSKMFKNFINIQISRFIYYILRFNYIFNIFPDKYILKNLEYNKIKKLKKKEFLKFSVTFNKLNYYNEIKYTIIFVLLIIFLVKLLLLYI